MKKFNVVLVLLVFFMGISNLYSQETFNKLKGGFKECTAYIYPYIIGMNLLGFKQKIFQQIKSVTLL